MKDMNIISVNPSVIGFGALRPRNIGRIVRKCKSRVTGKTDTTKTTINLISGINKSVTPGWSAKLWLIRSAIAALLICAGIGAGADFAGFGSPEIYVTAGAMVMLGLLSRIASLTAATLFSVTMLEMMENASTSVIPAEPAVIATGLLALLCAICMLLGPGRYSIDQIIRHLLLKALERKRTRRARRLSGEHRAA